MFKDSHKEAVCNVQGEDDSSWENSDEDDDDLDWENNEWVQYMRLKFHFGFVPLMCMNERSLAVVKTLN